MQPTTIATLTLTLGLAACRGAAPEPGGPSPASRTDATVEPATQTEPPSATAPTPAPATEPPSDPQLAAKLADLDAMCQAVDRDYGDGTLGDYYAGLVPKTEWGKQQIAAGNATIQPGRLLEQAVKQLAPGGQLDQLAHCRKLLDYLDDVE